MYWTDESPCHQQSQQNFLKCFFLCQIVPKMKETRKNSLTWFALNWNGESTILSHSNTDEYFLQEIANWYELLKHLTLRPLKLIWLWTSPWSEETVNRRDCSSLPSMLSVFSMMQTPFTLYQDQIFPQTQELRSTDAAGVMNQVVCLCSLMHLCCECSS